MISPSPEFTITKPGMHLHRRKRDKPIRTYGKRSTAEPRGEPPVKKHKVTCNEPQRDSTASPKPEATSLQSNTPTRPENPDHEAPKTQPSKTSILNYFQPLPPTSPTATSNNQNKPSQTQSSPPSSPPVFTDHRKKAPRLLRIRPAPLPTWDPLEDNCEEVDEGIHTEKENAPCKNQHIFGSSKAKGSPLSGAKDKNHHHAHVEDQKPKALPRKKTPPAVQTTLNISSCPAFAECKACNTVWNPLYPGDVKYHARRHASVVRSRASSFSGR